MAWLFRIAWGERGCARLVYRYDNIDMKRTIMGIT